MSSLILHLPIPPRAITIISGSRTVFPRAKHPRQLSLCIIIPYESNLQESLTREKATRNRLLGQRLEHRLVPARSNVRRATARPAVRESLSNLVIGGRWNVYARTTLSSFSCSSSNSVHRPCERFTVAPFGVFTSSPMDATLIQFLSSRRNASPIVADVTCKPVIGPRDRGPVHATLFGFLRAGASRMEDRWPLGRPLFLLFLEGRSSSPCESLPPRRKNEQEAKTRTIDAQQDATRRSIDSIDPALNGA